MATQVRNEGRAPAVGGARDGVMVVTVAEAGRRLSVSPRSIWRFIAMGALTTVKFGRTVRIPSEQVERLAREGIPS